MTAAHRPQLQTLLRRLFQLDAADLDFGIYRIMNQRRREVESFIEAGLLQAVSQEFRLLEVKAIEEKKGELAQMAKQVREAYGPAAIDDAGHLAVPDNLIQMELPQIYMRVQAEMAQMAASTEAEAEIFNHLYTFFNRYYDNGDFVTKRRYSRAEKYAIPYNGEEVYFHWANRDQYYVKTADVLTDYAFRIESHGGYRVRFKLAAADTEQNNVKGDKRYFLPLTPSPSPKGKGENAGLVNYDEAKRELTFFFEYRPLTEEEAAEYGRNGVQAKIIEAKRGGLLKAVPDATLRALLATAPGADEVPLLDRHLLRWTRKSTSDYFIHKDLRGFLERELDFYLKNEVMRLDDLDTESAARAESYLTRLVVIKRIAKRIIEFLAQIEDFQKRLFERPKFVLASEWCVTLDRVPKSLYPAIIANKAQWEEWERLFGVKKPNGGAKKAEAFLADHPTLTIDTALYDADFKDQLLAALSENEGGLAGQMNGLLFHGENFQALTLLQEAYRGRVKCIYIDPPYNTGDDGFVYKDAYQHSTWLTMMEDRLMIGRALLAEDGTIFVSIGNEEQSRLGELCRDLFAPKSGIVIRRGVKSVQAQFSSVETLNQGYEFVLMYSKRHETRYRKLLMESRDTENGNADGDTSEAGSWNNHWRGTDRPTMRYPLFGITPETGQWRWGRARSEQAIENYQMMLNELGNPKPSQKEIDEWVVKRMAATGGKVDLLRLSSTRKPEHYVPPSKGKLASDLWTDLKPNGSNQLANFMGQRDFPNPKSTDLAYRIARFVCDEDDLVLDFFAGSGTTAHAVVNLNRDDGSNRRYILVEQGGYFDTVLKPRIRKVIYTSEWRDGQPVRDSPGSSHAFQYLRLESYEDTLDNLDLRPVLAPPPGLFPPETDDYLLKYMLDHETRELRLNVAAFATPFEYELRVRRDGVETRAKVDLLETANYLLGLTVSARRAYPHQERTYRVVSGAAPDGDTVAVIWRDTAGLDLKQEAAFVGKEILGDAPPDRLYVNGDSHLPGARPIESVFMAAMRETGS